MFVRTLAVVLSQSLGIIPCQRHYTQDDGKKHKLTLATFPLVLAANFSF